MIYLLNRNNVVVTTDDYAKENKYDYMEEISFTEFWTLAQHSKFYFSEPGNTDDKVIH